MDSHKINTVFLTSFHAHISRNILTQEFLERLRNESGLRVVIIVPDYKIDYFKKRFGAENILVDGIQIYQASRSRSGLFFKRLSMMLLDTDTKRCKYRYKVYRDKKRIYFWGAMLVGFLGRLLILRRLVRFLDFKFSPKGLFDNLFEKYAPQAVFATDIQNENDVALLQEARRRAVPILGMFRSWDNPTQYALRVFPDKLLVGSKGIREGAIKYQGYPGWRISIVGQPHYDRYLKGPNKTREDFFRDFGLDPSKKLVLFAPLGDKFIENNDLDQYVMEILGGIAAQVLVRFPPDEKVTLDKDFSKPRNMIFHYPGKIFSKSEYNDREIEQADDLSLINSICYSDVVVTGPTSILLDAAFFDKPVIAVNIAPTVRNFYDKVYCYQFSHIKKVMQTGGVEYVESRDGLLRAINQCFLKPDLLADGRTQIRAEWFSRVDGQAGERLVREIVDLVQINENKSRNPH